MSILAELNNAILNGQMDEAKKLTEKALESGMKVDDIISKGMIPAMDEVGDKFQKGEAFIPEMLIAARAMQAALTVVKPRMQAEGVALGPKVLLGSVKGDLHDIGKNLVGMMMEGAGFEVIDLGVDVPAEKFVAAVKEHKPKILGLSALLTTTLPEMKNVIEKLKAEGCREEVKVMVGGAPVNRDFAERIGADGYASDASGAVAKARELLA